VRVLLDTCVLSELRLPKPDAGVARVIADLDSDDLFVSSISIGEIVKGVALLEDCRKKRLLQSWLQAQKPEHRRFRAFPCAAAQSLGAQVAIH
jgi:predicted nucleic acid-binding protein